MPGGRLLLGHVWSKFLAQRKVPKQFRAPRPMSSETPQASGWRGIWTAELLGLALALLIMLSGVLRPLDRALHSTALAWIGPNTLSEEVAFVGVESERLGAEGCGAEIAKALAVAGAKAGILVSPLGELCPGLFEPDLLDNELVPPLVGVRRTHLRQGPGGRVVGFLGLSEAPELAALGLQGASWVAPSNEESVPVFSMRQLQEVPSTLPKLSGRVVVLGVAFSDQEDRLPLNTSLAVAAALEGAVRRPLPVWWEWLLVLIVNGAVLLLVRDVARRRRSILAVFFSLGLVVTLTVMGLFGVGRLMPVVSLTVSLGVAYAIGHAPRRADRSRADADALSLLKRAQELTMARPIHAIDSEEFWGRLAARVGKMYPADDVLVAELAPFSWRLEVHPNGDLTDAVIRERRRDIRRAPYANQQGAPVASVTANYLVMKDTPAVLIPMVAEGDVEGYLILIGKRAAERFGREPDAMKKGAAELGQLIRQRRLASQHIAARYRTTPKQSDSRQTRTGPQPLGMYQSVLVAVEQLRVFAQLLHHSPVGLLYADVFGDVRLIGPQLTQLVLDLGLEVGAQTATGVIESGQLSITALLNALRDTSGRGNEHPFLLSDLGERELIVPVTWQDPGTQEPIRFRMIVRRLSGEGEGAGAGFVGALVEDRRAPGAVPMVSFLPSRGDPLVVFSLSRMVAGVVQEMHQVGVSGARLQSPRDAGHVVGHKSELRRALREFLMEASRQSSLGPTLVVHEGPHRTLLKLLDVQLGAPLGALERVVAAPSQPPEGLGSLGALARTVQNSHGTVRIQSGEGWSSAIIVSLLRAKPHLDEGVPSEPLIQLKQHNRTLKI